MYLYLGNWIIWTTWTRNGLSGPACLVEFTTNAAYAKAMVRHFNWKLLGAQ